MTRIAKLEQALFAAGCFWGIQFYFDEVPGVIETTAGYTGGHTVNPTYETVCSHTTGHTEALLIAYDSKKVSYEVLLKHFFRMHDPTQVGGQGPNVGDQYRSAVFYFDEAQKKAAEKIKKSIQKGMDKPDKPIVTEISFAGPFYPAEDYHQKYTERTGRGMCHVPYKKL